MSRGDLQRVVTLLNATHVHYWLVGGSAIELVVGQRIRLHSDIDVFIKRRQLHRCIERFTEAGFEILPGTLGEEGVFLRKGELLVDFTNVQLLPDGSFRTFGIYATIPWPSGLLGEHMIDVFGEPCRTLTAQGHIAMKHVVAAWYAGGQLRDKDLEDIRWLAAMARCMKRDAWFSVLFRHSSTQKYA